MEVHAVLGANVAQVVVPERQAVFVDTGGCPSMMERRSVAEAVANPGEAALVVGATSSDTQPALCSV